jgi:hypothetical protein
MVNLRSTGVIPVMKRQSKCGLACGRREQNCRNAR